MKEKLKQLQMLEAEMARAEKCEPPEAVIQRVIENINFRLDSDPLISKRRKGTGKCECSLF